MRILYTNELTQITGGADTGPFVCVYPDRPTTGPGPITIPDGGTGPTFPEYPNDYPGDSVTIQLA